MDFIGRNRELKLLRRLREKKTSSLVCVWGRRRIGKSALIEAFGKEFKNFIEIQGLGPTETTSMQAQLDHFSEVLSEHFNTKQDHFKSWEAAFTSLSKHTAKGEYLILLDEISWVGRGDDHFATKIKSAWDTQLKKNPKLILVLCGSVSSWIKENILNNIAYEGRISLEIHLKELQADEIHKFWQANKFHFGTFEKMILLSVTGGVPKYLEEILKSESAFENLINSCFQPEGFLYNEYEKIFKEIFQKRSASLDKIVRLCLDSKLTPVQLAKKLKIDQNSDLSEQIKILEESGFISRDYYFKPSNGEMSKLSHLRIKDNYLRFYLKVIEPLKNKIEKGSVSITKYTDIKNIEAILGYQFENLILANRPKLHKLLGLTDDMIISSAPYAQRKTTINKGACQVDLLIHTNLDVFFLCEFKCQKLIDHTIRKAINKKILVCQTPKRSSVKPVLVYEGQIHPNDESELRSFFYKMIPLSSFFES